MQINSRSSPPVHSIIGWLKAFFFILSYSLLQVKYFIHDEPLIENNTATNEHGDHEVTYLQSDLNNVVLVGLQSLQSFVAEV